MEGDEAERLQVLEQYRKKVGYLLLVMAACYSCYRLVQILT